MPTQFPVAIDNFSNPLPGDKLNAPSHSGQHTNANDAIEAIEARIGVNGSTDTATVTGQLAAQAAGIADKQDELQSGVNIKTINGQSILGPGDLPVSGGGTAAAWGGITGTLANQTDLQTALDAKQPASASLSAIAALAGTAGLLRKSGAASWVLDTASYLTSVAWGIITGKPTTIAGYGITDAYTKTETDGRYPLKNGTGATGTWPISVTGSAASATSATSAAAVSNMNAGEPVVTLWKGTQAQYDAIATKNPNTWYAIVG